MGLLCAISPCPLASSVAAVGFLARRASGTGKALADGVAYALGRTLAFAGIGALLTAGLAAAPRLYHLLQKHLNMLLGPILVIMAAFLLDLVRPPFSRRLPPSKGHGTPWGARASVSRHGIRAELLPSLRGNLLWGGCCQ